MYFRIVRIVALYILHASTLHAVYNILPSAALQHVYVMQELKQKLAATHSTLQQEVPAHPCTELTQTACYIAHPDLQPYVERRLAKHFSLVTQIIARERAYHETHYVFYHGQNGSFRILQDIIQEFFTLCNMPDQTYKNFIFLRDWQQAPSHSTVKEFIENANHTFGKYAWSNYTADFPKYLLSVNPCLFSNSTNPGECTFEYFTHNASCRGWLVIDSLRNFIYTTVGLSSLKNQCDTDHTLTESMIKFENELSKKLDHLESYLSGGQLLQIFIPKKNVDHYVYYARAGGTPHSRPISEKLEELRHNQLRPYKIDTLQARILITPELLTPSNDIQMYRYQPSLTPEQEASYKQEIKQLVHELVTLLYQTGNLNVPKGCKLERLLKYLPRRIAN